MTVADLLTSPVLAGAIGLLSAVVGVRAVMRPRPKVRVRARYYDATFRNLNISGPIDPANPRPVCIEATNVGTRAVTIREVGFIMDPPLDTPVGRVPLMQIADSSLPVRLDPGQTHTSYGPAAKLPRTRFRQVVAIDTEGKTWKGRGRPLA